MKTPEQWIAEKSTYGSLFKSARWIAAIQSDAREGMVPAAELQAVEAERDRLRVQFDEAYWLLRNMPMGYFLNPHAEHKRRMEDWLQQALQPAKEQ